MFYHEVSQEAFSSYESREETEERVYWVTLEF
jgi:hypothetical protein